jgi:hypothetical protein
MDFIVDLDSIGQVRDALKSLPTEREDFYGLSIRRIQNEANSSNLGMRILSWILYSKRPLIIEELQDALAVKLRELKAASLTLYKL